VWEADPRRFGRGLTASIRRIFPQLGAVKIAHFVVRHTRAAPLHRMPQIGEIQRGVWVASAFRRPCLNNICHRR